MGIGAGRGRDCEVGGIPVVYVGGCGCCFLILCISLVAASFGIIDPHEYGVQYDGVAVRVLKEPFENGRHFVGLGSYFIKYPRQLQYIEFSRSSDGGSRNPALGVWSKDGQEIVLEAGFYWGLRKERLLDLYYKYEQGHVGVIEDVAANAIRDVATRFTTLQFFTNRSSIDREMSEALQSRISACCFADIQVFNLLGISVPTRFRTAVENVVINQQERTTLEILRDAIVLRQSINVVNAQADQIITLAKANANAQGLLTRSSAEAEALVSIENARTAALYNLSTSLGFGAAAGAPVNTSQLLTFMYADVVRSARDVVINVPRAIVNV